MEWRPILGYVASGGIFLYLSSRFDNWRIRRHTRRAEEIESCRTERLPVTTADIPILGYKGAGLHPTTFLFVPLAVGHNHHYGIEAFAECAMHGEHRSPDETCGCGFYAYASGHTLGLVSVSGLILEVELAGKVIVHEHGYRAEHQRVLHVWLGLCGQCAMRRATAIITYQAGTVAVCPQCLGPAPHTITIMTTMKVHLGDVVVEKMTYEALEVLDPARLAERLTIPVSEGVPPAA